MALVIESNLYVIVCVYVFVCVYLYTCLSPFISHTRWELWAGFLISEKIKLFYAFNPRDSKDKGRRTGWQTGAGRGIIENCMIDLQSD